MVKVLVYNDYSYAEQGLNHYDRLNKDVLKKIGVRGNVFVTGLGAGSGYYNPVDLCHDKAGFFFDDLTLVWRHWFHVAV